ncbi:hypothetical protein AMTRI_Chr02g219700 [Amborella trichopoda]
MMMHGEFRFIGMLGHGISLLNLRSGQRSELKWSTRKYGYLHRLILYKPSLLSLNTLL